MIDHDQHSSWLTIAGTALSGLGATLNGLNSLYGLSSQMPHLSSAAGAAAGAAPVVAGSVVSGAAALTSGWLTAAKIGASCAGGACTAGAGLTVSTLSLGAGCMYASVGFIYFIYSILNLNTSKPPRHAPVGNDAKQYPTPSWLSTRVLNWGVMGRVGAGKSTLINAFRGLRPRDPEAAPVGIGHTTKRPQPYTFTGDVAALTRNMARLWDLPGAGTKDWPCASYIRDVGLRHFDGVVLVTSGAFSENEVELIRQLMVFKVPYYVVRNKVDQDAINNAQDNDLDVEETLAEIRTELLDYGCDPTRTFCISAKHPECPDFDFNLLLHAMAVDVTAIRGELPDFHGEVSNPLRRTASWEPRSSKQLHTPPTRRGKSWHHSRAQSLTAGALGAFSIQGSLAGDTNGSLPDDSFYYEQQTPDRPEMPSGPPAFRGHLKGSPL